MPRTPYQVQYAQTHKKERYEYNKKYVKTHKQSTREYQKKYREEHKEEIKLYKKLLYLKNKEKIQKKHKLYYQSNKQKLNKRRVIYRTLKFKYDINFKLESILRNRLYHALKDNSKSMATLTLLGCSVDFLTLWLELQFKDGMSWDNYGYYGWHIDHVRPCAFFDLSLKEHQHACFHFTNLQPLWAKENFNKRDKLPENKLWF